MNRYFYSTLFALFAFFNPLKATTAKSQIWFDYAQKDLNAAVALNESDIVGYALYHIEQATEKALKAYLIATNTKFALTHDLVPLLNSCCKNDAQFQNFSADIKKINPYSTQSRYPNNSYVEPTPETVKSLIARAATLLRFVAQKMSN